MLGIRVINLCSSPPPFLKMPIGDQFTYNLIV